LLEQYKYFLIMNKHVNFELFLESFYNHSITPSVLTFNTIVGATEDGHYIYWGC